jgi:hypothetical protein
MAGFAVLAAPGGEFRGKGKKSQAMDLGWQWNLSATPRPWGNIAYARERGV